MWRWALGAAAALLLALAAFLIAGGDDDDDPIIDVNGHKLEDSALADWGQAGDTPLGVIIYLPGGAWDRPADVAFENYQRQAERANEFGYATVVVRYSAGPKALGEIERIYSQARGAYPGSGICAVGGSAGGHWALMLAAREPDLTCVVDTAGPKPD